MAEIEVINKQIVKNYDARILGGGLPEVEAPNYNLLDIGGIPGRPYRIGGSFTISIPSKYRDHHELIEKAVNNHIASGDYFVIIYE